MSHDLPVLFVEPRPEDSGLAPVLRGWEFLTASEVCPYGQGEGMSGPEDSLLVSE